MTDSGVIGSEPLGYSVLFSSFPPSPTDPQLQNFCTVLTVVWTSIAILAWKKFKFSEKIRKFSLFALIKLLRGKLNAGLNDAAKAVHKDKNFEVPEDLKVERIPEEGWSLDRVLRKLDLAYNADLKAFETGKMSGYIYLNTTKEHRGFLESSSAMGMFERPEEDALFTPLANLEAEALAIMKKLFNAPEEGCATFTSGGTESILVAMISYLEMGRQKGIKPHFVFSESLHPAFMKAAFYFDFEYSVAKNDENGRADNNHIIALIRKETMAVCLSCVNYPHGIRDDIEGINAVLEKRFPWVWIHVDGCLGGFSSCMSAYLNDGLIPVSDFRLSRVGTISADNHKYGQSPKGCSTIMFRSTDIKRAGLFAHIEGNRVYCNSTNVSERTAAGSLGGWAALRTLGLQGLIEDYKIVSGTVRELCEKLNKSKDFQAYKQPHGCVFAIQMRSLPALTLFDVLSGLKKKSWSLQMTQSPLVIHVTVSRHNADQIRENLMSDLEEVMTDIHRNPKRKIQSFERTMYGTMLQIPDARVADETVRIMVMEFNKLRYQPQTFFY